MTEGWSPGTAARVWFGLTALTVLTGLVISIVATATGDGGQFGSPVVATFNIFAYFTIQSNVIVGIISTLLALRPDRAAPRRPDGAPSGRPDGISSERSATLFRVFRLDGLVMIVITAIIYHTLLAGLVDLHGWSSFDNQLVHTVVPILAILGWLLFGPRRLITWRTLGLSVVYPILWVVFTLVRGAIGHWYPYPFIDAGQLGYGRVTLNVLAVTAGFLLLAAGALGLDRVLGRAAATRHSPA